MSAPSRLTARAASRARHPFPLQALERRVLFAAAPPALVPPVPLLDPLTVPQFVNDITNINPFEGFSYAPDNAAGNHYTVGAYQTTQNLLGPGLPSTPVFAYGPSQATATYPGRTFEVQKNSPIAVTWVNGLPEKHLMEVDPTLLNEGMPDMSLTYDPVTKKLAGGVPMVTHLHGGHTDAVYDGLPEQWWNAGGRMGEEYVNTQVANPTQPPNTFTYRNDQQTGTLWYHDHAMGVTRLNAYAGMAGFYIVHDSNDTGLEGNPLGLPGGKYEMGLAVQDKQFLSDGRMWFAADAQTWNGTPNVASTLPEEFGDTILVNGKAWPKMQVEAKRYRFRLLNASDSRFYTITLQNPATLGTTPIWQIGTDDGLLNAPVKLNTLTVAPGERVDFIVDFTKFKPGTRFLLTNSAPAPFPGGAKVTPGLTDRIMAFDVVAPVGADTSLPPSQLANLNRSNPIPKPTNDVPTRQLALYETTDGMGRITPLLGTPASSYEFMDDITEYIKRGDTEVWQIFNNTADTHPIHVHQVSFQVLTRNTFSTKLINLGVSPNGVTDWGMGPVKYKTAPVLAAGNEVAWKDTIQLNPGEVITLRTRFDLGGKYVIHCHILSHEEHDMMRYIQVGDNPYPAPGFVVDALGQAVAPAAPAIAAVGDVLGISVRTGVSAFSDIAVTASSLKKPADDTAAALLDETAAPV